MFRAEDFHGVAIDCDEVANQANEIHGERCPQHSESQAKRMAVQFKDAYEKVKARVEDLESRLHTCHDKCDKAGCINTRLREALVFAEMTISHALALGYVGEGSTEGMFKDAGEKCQAALEKCK